MAAFFTNIRYDMMGDEEFLVGMEFSDSLLFLRDIFFSELEVNIDLNLDGQFVFFQNMKTISYQVMTSPTQHEQTINLDLSREQINSILVVLKTMNYTMFDAFGTLLNWRYD